MMGLPSGSDAVKRHLAARVLQRKAAQAPNGPMQKKPMEKQSSIVPASCRRLAVYTAEAASTPCSRAPPRIELQQYRYREIASRARPRNGFSPRYRKPARTLSPPRILRLLLLRHRPWSSASKCRGVLQTAGAVSQTEIMKTVKTLQLYRVLRYPGLV